MAKDRKILVMHTGGIGDMLMLGPSLRLLRSACPLAEIHFLGSPGIKEVIERHGAIDEFIYIDTPGIKRGRGIPGAALMMEALKTMSGLRKERYDVFLVFQPILSLKSSVRIAFLSLFLNAGKTAGRNTDGRGFFFKEKAPESTAGARHEVERMSGVARIVCGNGFLPPIEVPVHEGERKCARDIFAGHGIGSYAPVVVVAPGFTKATRRWYEERWAALADRIINECNARVILVGGRGEKGLARSITCMMKNGCVNLVGRLKIFETAAVIDRADVFIGNDSGLMHMASALRPLVIALFGPGDLNRIRPYGDERGYKVVRVPQSCSPCYREFCEDHTCMKSITVDEVYNAFIELYRGLGLYANGLKTGE